ncbi:aspartyl-phosphate phosphatase Spo0E family protein [Sutcliffiella halmapala]|uniref:aspartyl-phosphate phosphatase Spo0E family protein n=1 Tax=Sutcliffiella halmapala TaxID=79882 RepID=UPI000995DE2A|nr:aspartyl-phosphate phosphatase Spo0E family protein [Sutcliffiella halmapala]
MSYEGHVENLLLLIKEKRASMIVLANKTGYISEQTIKCSQDLDKLIYEYQEIIYQKRTLKKPLHSGSG